MKKTTTINSLATLNHYVSTVRHTLLNMLLNKAEFYAYFTVPDEVPIIEEPDDMARVRKEIAEKLKNSTLPCMQRAYGNTVMVGTEI